VPNTYVSRLTPHQAQLTPLKILSHCPAATMPGNLAIDVLSINIGSFDKIPEEEFKAMDGSKRELLVTKDLRNEISRGYKFMVTKPYSAVIRVCSVGLTPSNTDDSTNKIQCNKERIVVPSGFLADGNASGQFNESPAWVFHDWLYAKQKIGSRKISRSEADKITLRIMVKVPILYERDLTQLAMTLAGLYYEASWNLAGKRGPEFALVEGVRRPIDPTGAKQ
jgi:hypothetical protein